MHLTTYIAIAKFQATEFVANKTQVMENPVRTKAVEVAVFGHIAMEPTLNTSKLSDVSGVRQTTV